MIDQSVVADLRRMFIDGATPSQLMNFISDHHTDDPGLHFIIMDYFREAFGISLLRVAPGENNYSPDSRHAHFNRDVIPEMIQRIDEWNTENLEGSWLKSIAVKSYDQEIKRLSKTRFEELDRVWHSLTDDERLYIIQTAAGKNRYWQVLKCVAALAERLQEKVVELENQLKERTALDRPRSNRKLA